MVEQVRRYMEHKNMVEPKDIVLAGVSGGADSVCLLLVLAELAEAMDFSLEAVHVEHGIRGAESERDADFVRQLCEKLQVPLAVHHVDVLQYSKEHSVGTEEAARLLRYEVFAGEAGRRGSRCSVALAHQMEDNAETMLMALVRGTGLDGLCGMLPVREDSVRYIRPLLAVSRSMVEAFLAERGQSCCTDATNFDTQYTRNYIRHEVIPLLARVNPQAVAHMNRTAAQLVDLRAYMEHETDEAYRHAVSRDAGGELLLDAECLLALPQALRERVVHRAVGEIAGARRDIGAVHIGEVLELLERQSGRRADLSGRVEAVREYSAVRLRRKRAGDADVSSVSEIAVTAGQLAAMRPDGPQLVLPLGGDRGCLELRLLAYDRKVAQISTKNYTKWFDYDMIKTGFSVRRRQKGDYFVLDRDGHRKKLSNYFVDEKIPAARREKFLLLAQGAEVLWLIGGRMGVSGMVTERTRRVLEVSYRGENGHGLQEET